MGQHRTSTEGVMRGEEGCSQVSTKSAREQKRGLPLRRQTPSDLQVCKIS